MVFPYLGSDHFIVSCHLPQEWTSSRFLGCGLFAVSSRNPAHWHQLHFQICRDEIVRIPCTNLESTPQATVFCRICVPYKSQFGAVHCALSFCFQSSLLFLRKNGSEGERVVKYSDRCVQCRYMPTVHEVRCATWPWMLSIKVIILAVADGEWPLFKTDATSFIVARYKPTVNMLCLWLIRKES
jgi:hypothetical protein